VGACSLGGDTVSKPASPVRTLGDRTGWGFRRVEDAIIP
jgi:hypothetical protein